MRLVTTLMMLVGVGCASSESWVVRQPQCLISASRQVSANNEDEKFYGMGTPAGELIARATGSYDLSLGASGSSLSNDTASLSIEAVGAAVAHHAEPESQDLVCPDWIDVPVQVTLITSGGALNESFGAALRIDEVSGAGLTVRIPQENIGGSLDIGGAFEGDGRSYDRFLLAISLARTIDGKWQGAGEAVAVEIVTSEACPNNNPDVDVDCPGEQERYKDLFSLATPHG